MVGDDAKRRSSCLQPLATVRVAWVVDVVAFIAFLAAWIVKQPLWIAANVILGSDSLNTSGLGCQYIAGPTDLQSLRGHHVHRLGIVSARFLRDVLASASMGSGRRWSIALVSRPCPSSATCIPCGGSACYWSNITSPFSLVHALTFGRGRRLSPRGFGLSPQRTEIAPSFAASLTAMKIGVTSWPRDHIGRDLGIGSFGDVWGWAQRDLGAHIPIGTCILQGRSPGALTYGVSVPSGPDGARPFTYYGLTFLGGLMLCGAARR